MKYHIDKEKRDLDVPITNPFPFSIDFDNDISKTKLDIIMSNTEDADNLNNILRSTINLKLLFIFSRKAQLPFLQEGEISLIDNKSSVLASQNLQGIVETSQLNFNPNNTLVQKLTSSSDSKNDYVSIKYNFRCYDVWSNEVVIFSDTIPFFNKLKNALHGNSNYYCLDQNVSRLNKYYPSKLKKEHKSILRTTSNNFGVNNFKINNSNKLNFLTVNATMTVKPELSNVSLLSTLNHSALKKEYYPKVNNLNNNYWIDYKHSKLYWVKPDFNIIRPKNGEAFSSSPFKFSFKNIGIMPDGSVALEGKLSIKVNRFLNKEWVKDIPQKKRKKLIKMLNPTYKIKLPYVDNNGRNKFTYLISSLSETKGNDITLEFTVSNEWVRLLYASLSTPNIPENNKPSLYIDYDFDSMIKKPNVSSFLISGVHLGSSRISLNNFNKISFKKTTAIKSNKLSKKVTRAITKPLMANTNLVNVNTLNLNLANANISDAIKKKYVHQKSRLSKIISIFYNCTQYGDYYVEQKNNTNIAIGCSEPMRIGQIRHSLYTKINELSHSKYDVYKSNVMPQLFIIVPNRYILSRRLQSPEQFSPELFLHGAIDIEDYSNSLCLVDLKLQPEITYWERYLLKQELKKYTAYEPQIKYITESIGKETFSWNLSDSIIEDANTHTFEHFIRGTFETNIANSQLCKSLLENNGITGLFTKKLDENLVVRSQMIVSLDNIAQPWDGKGIEIETLNNKKRLTNELESPIYIDRLININDNNSSIPIQEHVESNNFIDFNSNLRDDLLIPIYSIQTSQQALSENYSYIEDLFQQIICLDFLSSDQFGQLLEIHIGIQDTPPYAKVDFYDGIPQKDIELLIPINEIISSTQFGFYIKYRTVDNTIVESNWIHHNFSSQGNIINITKNIII